MEKVEEYVHQKLFAMQDTTYKAFHCKLMPTVDPDRVIGVRTPLMRNFAKEFAKEKESEQFLDILPHKYYEENNLHGFLIEKTKDYDRAIELLDAFLPYVDNWATCDLMSPKIFKKHLPELYEKIVEWTSSNKTYTIRFGIEILMSFYLDENFCEEHLKLVADLRSEEYYVNMMIAWYFATALAKQYEKTIPYFQTQHLDLWTHNKAIQKAIESNRIDVETKKYLRTLKIVKKA